MKRIILFIVLIAILLVGVSNYIIGTSNDRYDIEENLPLQIAAEMNYYVPYVEIPQDLIHAVVSIEDRRFFSHSGIDIRGLGRAFFTNVREGGFEQGGSTITQQLVKNLFLTQEQTIERKVKELFLAYEVERNYSKEEIIEMYLNYNYFGAGAYGIYEASEKFFDKEVRALTLEECAMLAGVLNGPSIFNPVEHFDRALQRQNIVLRAMEENNYIKTEWRDH